MASVIHIAEIAAILAVAYMLGWAIGYVAHRLLATKPLVEAAIPEARLAAATGTAEALVKAPVIAPVADPVVEPPAAAVSAETTATVAPAEPGATAAGVEPAPVAVPPDAVPVIAEAPLVPESGAAAPEPPAVPDVEAAAPAAPLARGFRRFRPAAKAAPAPEPVADAPPADFTATPATLPGVAWTGEIRGRSASGIATAESVAPSPEVVSPVPDNSGPTAPAMTAPSEAPIVEPSAPPIEPEPRPEPVVAAPPSSAEPTPVYDEDAAMRAIEGGWSRVGARAMSEAPELSDLGAAVAAATTAVEQVLAKAGIDIDTATSEERPKGLGRPRNGVKDDLKRIVGLGALDESTLNNLGVYHYEQIARWNAAQVAWMENHVFARGRIAREDWQSQARALIPPPSF